MKKALFVLLFLFASSSFAQDHSGFTDPDGGLSLMEIIESAEPEDYNCHRDGCPGNLVCYNGTCTAVGPTCQTYEDCPVGFNVCYNGRCYI